jgi:hypothetical protein
MLRGYLVDILIVWMLFALLDGLLRTVPPRQALDYERPLQHDRWFDRVFCDFVYQFYLVPRGPGQAGPDRLIHGSFFLPE